MSRQSNNGNFPRRMLDALTYAAIGVCALVFALGVHDTMSGRAAAQPPTETIPFNSVLFFGLIAVPILLSLAVAAVLYFVQMYRASAGTRNRGWEELL